MIAQWIGEHPKTIDVEMGIEYRMRLFEKTGLAIAPDGRYYKLVNLEGMEGEFLLH